MSRSVTREASSTTQKEILELLNKYANAIKHKNVDDLLSTWTEDGVWLPPLVPPVRGREALKKIFGHIFSLAADRSEMTFEPFAFYSDSNAGDSPQIIYSYGELIGTLEMKDGNVLTLPQKYSAVFHLINNEWKMAVACWNVTGEPPQQLAAALRPE